jgi:transposase-like protein
MEEIKIKEINELKDQYPVIFKRWLSREIEQGKLSCKEAKERFSLNSEKTIWGWIHQYGLGKELSLATMTPEEKQEKVLLEKRIKELEKALGYAKLKNIAVETMIDVAEEQFRITIRKKAGPKQ